MQQPTSVQEMWNAYLRSLGDDPATTERTFSVWHFCDNAPCADALAALVKTGRKRGTTSALWEYEAAQEALPAVGEYSVITNWEGQAQAIIRTTAVEIVPFNQVTAAFAWTEGEGDRSLESWRQVHWGVFTRSLAAYGRRPAETMPVVCETFEVVYGADPA